MSLDKPVHGEANWDVKLSAALDSLDAGVSNATAHAASSANPHAVTAAQTGAPNVVVHGSTAGTARPSGATVVHWIGSVAPSNKATNDEWTDTANKLLKRWTGSAWDAFGSGTYETQVHASASYSSVAPSSADVTHGNVAVQEITGNKWFKGRFVQGNNTGLAGDPRQPFQVNNVIDGSTLDGSTFLGDKVGVVLDTTFKGGFSGEAGFGVADPGYLFGTGIFTKTGSTASDLAGITNIEAGFSEAHLYTPSAALTNLIGFQTVANVESTATAATVTNAYGLYARGPVDNVGGVITNAYAVYAEAPTGGAAGKKWALYCAGMAQFNGATPNTSGAGAPAGAYLGIASNSTIGLELSNGTNNFRIANDIAGHLNFEAAGSAVLTQMDTTGGWNMTGRVFAGSGTSGTNTPNTQASAKGAYLGRAASGTVALELADGTTTMRVANDSAGALTFEKAGVSVIAKAHNSGSFIVGGSALATSATDGFLYVPSVAGTPTGAPTAYSATVPLLVDTTASKLWARIGGAWKSVTFA